MSGTKILWGQIAVVFLIVLISVWSGTQWVAWRLGFQPQLGPAWFELWGVPIYYPPALFWWWYSLIGSLTLLILGEVGHGLTSGRDCSGSCGTSGDDGMGWTCCDQAGSLSSSTYRQQVRPAGSTPSKSTSLRPERPGSSSSSLACVNS